MLADPCCGRSTVRCPRELVIVWEAQGDVYILKGSSGRCKAWSVGEDGAPDCHTSSGLLSMPGRPLTGSGSADLRPRVYMFPIFPLLLLLLLWGASLEEPFRLNCVPHNCCCNTVTPPPGPQNVAFFANTVLSGIVKVRSDRSSVGPSSPGGHVETHREAGGMPQ